MKSILLISLFILGLSMPAFAEEAASQPSAAELAKQIKVCHGSGGGCRVTYRWAETPGDEGTHDETVETPCAKTRGCTVFNTKSEAIQ